MKSIFRATAILSASSIVSILFSFASTKVLATILQPAGYGYYGLLQSFVGLTVLFAGMGMATGLVRQGAGAATRRDAAALSALCSGAWLLFGGLGGIVGLLLFVLRVPLSRWALGSPDHAETIVLMGIAILFTVAANIQTGILNAHHRVNALAKYGLVNTVVGGLATIIAVLVWHLKGVVPAVIGGAVASWFVSRFLLGRQAEMRAGRSTRRESVKAAWALLRFGAPFTCSMLVGTGAQLALPMLVLHLLSAESVGYYRAAMGISVGYLGFLVTAMGQDYYPRLSAVRDEPDKLAKLINEQHRLVMLFTGPMILGTLALVPLLVPLVYSRRFTPTVEILEWQLIGDLFKFSSWTMSFAVLARCSMAAYFLTESVAGATALVTTWFAVRWFGLPGLGIGFLVTYIIYYFVVWAVARQEIPLVWTASNKKMIALAVTGALIVRILPATRFAVLRTPVAITLAVIMGIFSLVTLWREFMTAKESEHGMPSMTEGETLAATEVGPP